MPFEPRKGVSSPGEPRRMSPWRRYQYSAALARLLEDEQHKTEVSQQTYYVGYVLNQRPGSGPAPGSRSALSWWNVFRRTNIDRTIYRAMFDVSHGDNRCELKAGGCSAV